MVGRVPHRNPTRGSATDAAAHALVPCLIFYLFIFFGFALNWADSAKIGSYESKSALNHAGTTEIGFE